MPAAGPFFNGLKRLHGAPHYRKRPFEMNHQDALQEMAVERYLLGELSGEALDRFEEHLFDCPLCVMDLRTGTTFINAARSELRTAVVGAPVEESPFGWLSWLLRPSFLAPALAACLLVVGVESFVLLPGMRREVARVETPSVLNNLVLANAGARGDSVPEVAAPQHGAFLLSVDVPGRDGFSGYLFSLYSPAGAVVWQTKISPQQASDAVLVHVPTDATKPGLNTLLVQGLPLADSSGGKLEDLARYKFQLNVSK
jgi:Putative zinc-finger